MLEVYKGDYYRVKKGDTLLGICREFKIPECVFVRDNGIDGELFEGRLVYMNRSGNYYTVKGGDSKISLCGSEERYFELNGTHVFFIGMKIYV